MSITTHTARASNVWGTVRPSAFPRFDDKLELGRRLSEERLHPAIATRTEPRRVSRTTDQAIALSAEQHIARIDYGAIHEGDDLVRCAAVEVDLPVGGVVLGEGGARAITDEMQ